MTLRLRTYHFNMSILSQLFGFRDLEPKEDGNQLYQYMSENDYTVVDIGKIVGLPENTIRKLATLDDSGLMHVRARTKTIIKKELGVDLFKNIPYKFIKEYKLTHKEVSS